MSGNTELLHVRINPQLNELLSQISKKLNIPVAELVRRGVEEVVSNYMQDNATLWYQTVISEAVSPLETRVKDLEVIVDRLSRIVTQENIDTDPYVRLLKTNALAGIKQNCIGDK